MIERHVMDTGQNRRLSIGIQLPEVERIVDWSEYVSMAQLADRSHFDSIWVGDHLIYRGDGRPERGPHEAWTLLSALAAVTERVTLGPLVACVGFHPPAVIAKMASTISNISNGRLVLGLGAGWNEPEFEAFDIPFDRRASRFEESLSIIVDLVEGKRCSFEGEFHSINDAVLLPQPRHDIPIMVGSNGDRVLRASLRVASSWNTWFDWFGNDAEGFARLNEHVSNLVIDCGRDPSEVGRSACLLVRVDEVSSERPEPEGGHAVQLDHLVESLRDMSEAGADEVIIVADPITEVSMQRLDEVISEYFADHR
jgi:alkanesulfonate monooxygenase SsuD/methylene tetrahydromethanopterin reductase-like flavin-dependent oxidoreductase (luciferase family)